MVSKNCAKYDQTSIFYYNKKSVVIYEPTVYILKALLSYCIFETPIPKITFLLTQFISLKLLPNQTRANTAQTHGPPCSS